MRLLKPKPLKTGATLGVVAPSEWLPEANLKAGCLALEGLGFRVVVHPQCFLKDHRLAGADKARADALHDVFLDPTVDGIICARGGAGAQRTAAHLDMNIIRKNPKVFCGYSDITLLLHALQQHAGLVTFHGPMLTTFQKPNPFSAEHFRAVLGGATPILPFEKALPLRTGEAEGALTGGNLCLLTTLLGTPDDFDTDGKILFIEDVDEHPYTLDRMLWHLHRAGKLKNIKGLIIGEMLNITENKPENPWGHSFFDVVRELLPPETPCVANAPCGHGLDLATLPLGGRVKLKVGTDSTHLALLEPAVL